MKSLYFHRTVGDLIKFFLDDLVLRLAEPLVAADIADDEQAILLHFHPPIDKLRLVLVMTMELIWGKYISLVKKLDLAIVVAALLAAG